MRSALGIFCAVVIAGTALAQSLSFEIASVKPNADDKPGLMNGGPLPPGPFNMTEHDPSRITWTNVRLIRVLMMAYDLPPDRISGPGWLHTETYDIQAPVPTGTTVDDFKAMVRSLLAERFRLTAHREVNEVSGYALEVAPAGIRIKHSGDAPPAHAGVPQRGSASGNALMFVDDSGYPAPRPGNPIYLPGSVFSATIKAGDLNRATVLNQPMTSIAAFFGTTLGAPVEDRTRLTGEYDFHLEYKPGDAPRNAGDAPEVAAPAPDIFDAVQKQLGLRLTRATVPQETLVIDRVEKTPTDN
jgi:uncharacterized protein (TIGR03435 family)